MDAVIRMMDANLNRAREGLRVVEDAARFGLDDAGLAARAKGLRHGLREAAGLAGLDGLTLAASRDTAGDVGRRIKTAGELERRGLGDIATAAAKRAGEALRVLGEGLKTRPGAGAARAAGMVERARYELYELERELVLRLGTGRAEQWRLCVLVTESLCRRPWKRVVEESIEGGADCVQIREKGLSDRELLKRVKWVVGAAGKGRRAAVIVNDRADIALLAGADGVHLGQDDLPVSAVRALAGGRLIVGVSTHDLREARAAWRDGADYVGVGAMFPTETKRRATSGAAYLRAFLAEERGGGVGKGGRRAMPHLAIGGITAGNVGELVKVGCRGVAVSGAVCGAEEPGRVCRAIRRRLGR
jgi:thiamine-phosphate pyrophosphorylase